LKKEEEKKGGDFRLKKGKGVSKKICLFLLFFVFCLLIEFN